MIRRVIAVPAAVLMLSLSLALPAAAREPMALGVSIPDGTPNTAQIENAVDAFIASNDGIKPAIYSVWSQWGSRGGQTDCTAGQGSCYFPADTLQMLHDKDIQGMVWWEPINPSKPLTEKYSRHKKTYQKKPDGSYRNNPYIREWAQQAKAFGQANDTTIILRFAHEANGTWFPWTVGVWDNTPYTFKKFWRHVWKIFKNEGALPYVDFLWSVTNKSCNGCNPYAKIYPGDQYVDYAGLTAFNWGAQRKWKPMLSVLEKPMAQLWQVTHKPVIVAELATHYRPTSKSKANWIKNGYSKTYNRWNRIKAVMYLNTDEPKQQWGHPDWRLVKGQSGAGQEMYSSISSWAKFQGDLRP